MVNDKRTTDVDLKPTSGIVQETIVDVSTILVFSAKAIGIDIKTIVGKPIVGSKLTVIPMRGFVDNYCYYITQKEHVKTGKVMIVLVFVPFLD